MDPLTKIAISVLYNQLLEFLEEPWTYSHTDMAPFIRKTGDMFNYAIEKQAHFTPNDDTDVDDLLIAFERYTRSADREYMMLGLGPVSSTPSGFERGQRKRIDSVAMEAGTLLSVGWPKAGVRELVSRLRDGGRCRMICVHNHPYGLLHEIFRVLGLGLPGASSQDRDVATQHMINAILRNEIVPEFYLVEDRQFRRILAPSWETWARLFGPLLANRRDPSMRSVNLA